MTDQFQSGDALLECHNAISIPLPARTIGDEWMVYQVQHYKTNTQPYYVMLGANGEDLNNGSADYEHDSNPEDFKEWLYEGLELYKKSK